MILLCFQVERSFPSKGKKKLVKLPAVIFTNNSFSQDDIERNFPELKGIRPSVVYPCDADESAVPLNVLLYDDKKALNVLEYTENLENEIRQLKTELNDLRTGGLSSQEVIKDSTFEKSINLDSLGVNTIDMGEGNKSDF